MIEIFIYPILPAVVFGSLNWWYWKNQGYTSKVQLLLNICIFYAGFYILAKLIF